MLTKWIYSNQIHESIVSGISAIYKKIRNFMNFNATKKIVISKISSKKFRYFANMKIRFLKKAISIVSVTSIIPLLKKKM